MITYAVSYVTWRWSRTSHDHLGGPWSHMMPHVGRGEPSQAPMVSRTTVEGLGSVS